jgi:TolB-like protein/Tfp pilus assembly protein PilF
MIGQTISHYRITAEIGAGGMGVVYEAEDLNLKRTVAIKFLPTELTRDAGARKRFITEAQTASSLDHTNVCNIHEVGETDDGRMFIVMTRYTGETLKDRIARGPLQIDDALDIAGQITAGLSKAHAQGIVHRDIKPGNVFITEDGVAKILDFGLARIAGESRLTKTGTTVGTVAYMSPEQVDGRDVDARSDVWSVGAVLYEMLTGQAPFRGDAEPAIVNSILSTEPEPITKIRSEVPVSVEDVVDWALAKDQNRRYQTADDLGDAIGEQRDLLNAGIKTGGSASWKRFRRNRRAVCGMSVVAAVALGVIATLVIYQPSDALDSLAVLPVEVIGAATPRDSINAIGMTVELTSMFSRMGIPKVIHWKSSLMYKGTDKSLQQIGAELDVQTLVWSTMQRADNEVRISAQLIESSTARVLWSEAYVGKLSDMFRLQNRIAMSAADAINFRIKPEAERRLAATRDVNPDAWDAYQRGMFFLAGAGANLDKSVKYFERAIELDSTYARAYAALAEWYMQMNHTKLPAADYGAKAKEYALKSLKLDPHLAEGHAALGHVLFEYEFDMERAQIEFDRAFEIDPTYTFGTLAYSHYLISLARFEEAAEFMMKAARLDPASPMAQFWPMYSLIYTGRYEDALVQVDNAFDMFPDWKGRHDMQLCWAYRYSGQWDLAVAIYDTIPPESRSAKESAELAYCCYEAGQKKRAIALIDSLDLLTGDQAVSPRILAWLWALRGDSTRAAGYLGQLEEGIRRPGDYVRLAHIYSHIGDFDRAFHWVERMYEDRISWLTRLRLWGMPLNHANVRRIVNDPRYQEWVEKLNLDT